MGHRLRRGAPGRVPRPAAGTAAREALDLLLGRRESGGWGYHALLPADADTTTWVLRLAAAVGAPEAPRLVEARAFVASQTDDEGGSTYPVEAAPALADFLQMPATTTDGVALTCA